MSILGWKGDGIRAAALLVAWSAFAAPPAAPLMGQEPAAGVDLAGFVLDSQSRRGIEDVIVRLEGSPLSAATDAEGHFLIRQVPPGDWTLVVTHVRYGTHEHDLVLEPGLETVQVEVRLAEEAIELEPIVVESETRSQREAREQGSSFWEVTREEIEQAIGSSRHMADLMRQTVPGLRVRQAHNLMGTDVCMEFRAAASISIVNARPCNHPMVFLDGVPVGSPQYLYGSLPLNDLERIQVIPPGEAGARYGTGSLYGVLLIETRRPGLYRPDDPVALPGRRGPVAFDWERDPAGHNTLRTVLGATLGNALGLAAGIAVARQCIDIVQEEIESSCGSAANIASGAAAFALPALGSTLGARWGGGTDLSVGRPVPALLGAGLMLFPGYAFSLATVGGGEVSAVNRAGNVLLVVGVPLAATVADRIFRRLREGRR